MRAPEGEREALRTGSMGVDFHVPAVSFAPSLGRAAEEAGVGLIHALERATPP